VAANLEAEVIDNGRPAKGSPVIRFVEVAEDDMGTRVLTRLVPAFVISGALHVVIIGFFVLFVSSAKEAQAKTSDEELITTQVEEPKEDEKNLVNEEVGFDPDLAAATTAEREESVNVEAPKSDEPIGLPDQSNDTAPSTALSGLGQEFGGGALGEKSPDALLQAGPGGGMGAFTTPGMLGRVSGATKDKLLKAGGGNTASEAAVASGLAWLHSKQLKDGSWEFDGNSKDKVAATGMALLPFLAAGETHKYGKKYKATVEKGLNWLMARAGNSGFSGSSNMYSHAIGAVALCEAAGMTKDPAVKAKATAVTGFLVRAQAKDGSWGYQPNREGDTSIVGWQIQALASARLAEIKFDKDKVYKDSNRFLDSVSSDSGAKYGYRDRSPSQSLTPVGLLSKYYMGEINPRHPAFARGVDFLKQFPPRRGYWDMYYYYYATQVVHFFEGPDWHKFWNPKMRDLLIDLQDKSGDPARKGSWERDSGFIGSACGRLGTTCLALLTLEVYYRHLPLYKRDSGGLMELER
jgi:hypothetical protein